MSELETKIEAEAPEFADELSDEALDRTETSITAPSSRASSSACTSCSPGGQ